MKKTTITYLFAGLLFVTGLRAQTVQEGINDLNSGRISNAIKFFEKLLTINPNNIEATYWLGQSYLETEEIRGSRIADARNLYQKAMQSSANAPLVLVGMGHINLLENKTSEARQNFETARTMTRTKKGDDPAILTAIGRANVDAKNGDFKYAIELLKDAVSKEPKNLEALIQLGNAYRKADPGKGGSDAYIYYNKVLEVNPNYSIANLRLAKLFQSQYNYDFVLKYLNDAVAKDPRFTAGYYELFYYFFYRAKFPEAEENLKKYINSKLPENDIQDQYLYAQLCWAQKDFQCAVTKAESVTVTFGKDTKPKVYRLLADSYFQKGDFPNAKKYSDEFFLRKNPDDITLYDFQLRADILSKTGGTVDEIFSTYMQGAAVDTLAALKVDLLKKGAAYFKENKLRDKEALVIHKIIELKPNPTINDFFDLTLAYYFNENYGHSRNTAKEMEKRFPDQVYGYEWVFNNSRIIDTVKKDSIAVPDAMQLLDFSNKDTSKFRKQIISAASFLSIYYANDTKQYDSAIVYLKKWQSLDTANSENIQKNIDILTKASSNPKGTTPEKTKNKSSSLNKKSAPKKKLVIVKK